MVAKKVVQPEVNIGLVGHVDHGKTTLTEALTGRWTDTHSEELKKGITIRIGYADTIFRKCKDGSYTVLEKCEDGSKPEQARVVSFVDAPGHESLMATMLAGATLMDGALLLIAANEEVPQPQTSEHLQALEIIGIEHVVVVQNKIDLVSKEQAVENYKAIKEFLKNSRYKDAPIVPISAQQRINLSHLISAIEDTIPTPSRSDKDGQLLYVARSFDINKPGTPIDDLQGGVIGGSIREGSMKKGQEIEIVPGLRVEKKGRMSWQPLKATITSVKTGGQEVPEVHPGGSVGIQTTLDPAVVKSDALAGSLAGVPGKLPPVWEKFTLETTLLDRVVGEKDQLVVDPIKKNEFLMLNVNAAATVGQVVDMKKNKLNVTLRLPVCAEEGSRVTISRRLGTRWRLIGFGIIRK